MSPRAKCGDTVFFLQPEIARTGTEDLITYPAIVVDVDEGHRAALHIFDYGSISFWKDVNRCTTPTKNCWITPEDYYKKHEEHDDS